MEGAVLFRRRWIMRCPYCKQDNDRVTDTRSSEDGGVIRRRRECLSCNHRYTTHERPEDTPVRILKKNGVREPFNREKLLAGIMRALEKRPPGPEEAEAVVDAIERALLDRGSREIASSELGEMVMQRLRGLDAVAFVRFASVYRQFQAVDEFVRLVQDLGRAPDGAEGDAPDAGASP